MSLVHETLYGFFRNPFKVLCAAGLQSGQRVLEVGCGPGFFTIPAAKIVGKTGSIFAVDINPFAVRHVQKKIESEGVTNVKLALANVGETDLTDESFDLAFLFGFGHPIGDWDIIWSELHRLLKSGGALAVEGRLRPPPGLFEPVKREGRICRFRKVG